jgi:2-polyprenyl-3-methyl-5-hydroxy-6-metoxy-1,4-benzoquinol methylase
MLPGFFSNLKTDHYTLLNGRLLIRKRWMDKNYFKKYYEFEKTHWWFLVRSKIIEDKLAVLCKSKNNLEILNIGVASGQTSLMLSKFGDVTSVEYDKDACKFLKDELNIEAVYASINQLPFSNESFDLVCAFDVIEHVEDDCNAIDEMYRVCKPEGIVFITVPAFMHLWSKHDLINHHYRRYTLKQLLKLFNKLKGDIIYKSYFNTLLYLPILLIRKVSNNITYSRKNETNSDFELFKASVINSFMKFIFNLERSILHFVKMPFGVSIMVLFSKKSTSN